MFKYLLLESLTKKKKRILLLFHRQFANMIGDYVCKHHDYHNTNTYIVVL